MKKLAILTSAIKVLISGAGVLMLIGWLIAPVAWPKPLSYFATIILPFIPNFFKLIKVEFSTPLILAYEAFLIIAMVLGIDLNWYSEVLVATNGDSYYDKIVHFSAGVLVAVMGQELLTLSGNRKSARWFRVLFLLGIVAIVTVGWECFEFLYDTICGGHMQELVKSGVSDTMWDMIVSLIGGAICTIFLVKTSRN